ncbi:MAG: hypothetical protein ACI4MS_08185 [Candidatus Coproplasma sp.]
MKKLIIITIILILAVTMIACNYQVIDMNYKYDKAYVKIGEEWQDLNIKAWKDYEGEQLQLTLEDGTILVVHSLNCILYSGNLPKTIGEVEE